MKTGMEHVRTDGLLRFAATMRDTVVRVAEDPAATELDKEMARLHAGIREIVEAELLKRGETVEPLL